jgi:hypothetical protein
MIEGRKEPGRETASDSPVPLRPSPILQESLCALFEPRQALVDPIQAIVEPLCELSLTVDAMLEAAAVAIPEAVHPFFEAIPPASGPTPPGSLGVGPVSPPIHATFSSAPDCTIRCISVPRKDKGITTLFGLRRQPLRRLSAGQLTHPKGLAP